MLYEVITVAALTVYETYSFDNGVTGPTALFWWKESVLDGREGKYFASFVVDNGQTGLAASGDQAPAGATIEWSAPAGSLQSPTDTLRTTFVDPAGELARLEP